MCFLKYRRLHCNQQLQYHCLNYIKVILLFQISLKNTINQTTNKPEFLQSSLSVSPHFKCNSWTFLPYTPFQAKIYYTPKTTMFGKFDLPLLKGGSDYHHTLYQWTKLYNS